jgi:hypothetical protein
MSDAPATFCTNCGAPLAEGAHFCGACGHVRTGDVTSATPSPVGGAPGPVPPPGPVMPAPMSAPAAGMPGPLPSPAGARRSPVPIVLGLIGGFVLIALIAALVVVLVVDRTDDTADEVVLEPIAFQTPDPFTASVTSGTESPTPANAVKVAPAAGSAGGQQVPGAQPALYGGTKNNATCNPEQLITFLQANPDKAAAWAGVLGIATADIPGFVRGLTPTLLTRDTRVTNHGFANGRATSIAAVLQAGTAVMVDRFGTPRVKCGCGNPLTPPASITSATQVRGTQWSGFSLSTTVVVTVTVEVDIFVLVDVDTGRIYVRPPGSTGSADADPRPDQVCATFPSEPVCTTSTTAPTTTTVTTRPPTTPTPTVAPTVPPVDTGDAGATAIGIVQAAVASCPQGGTLGQYSVIAVEPGVYQVTLPVMFEGSDTWDTAVWQVDLNAANHNLTPQNFAAEWLTCVG